MSQLSEIDVNAVFRRLRALDEKLLTDKVNNNDRVHMLINACISEGLNTGPRITGHLESLGLNRRHAGILLAKGRMREPLWPNWGRREDGTYYAPPMPLQDI